MDKRHKDAIDDMLWIIIRAVVEEARNTYGMTLYGTVTTISNPYLHAVQFTDTVHYFNVPIGLHALVLEREQAIAFMIDKCNHMVRKLLADAAIEKRRNITIQVHDN